MKPRVVILSAFLTPFRSGAEACAEEVAARLSDRFDITIITSRMRRDLPRNDHLTIQPFDHSVRIIRVGFGMPLDKWLYPLLAPFAARKLHPQIIHAILETFAGLALHLCTWIVPRAKRILSLQTTNRNFLRRMTLRSPHVVTAISNALKKKAEAYGRRDVTVIPNGINYQEISCVCERFQKIPGRILFVGRLEQMKGVDVLLRALAELSTGHVHIVGAGSQRRALEQLAHQLYLADRVQFLGYVRGSDLHREYAEAEVFCGLSRSEALGNVFLEAQAAGCTVLATRIGGIPEIVKDGETGMLISLDDPATVAGALHVLLSNAVLRARLSSSAIVHAAEYDWNRISVHYERVLAALL